MADLTEILNTITTIAASGATQVLSTSGKVDAVFDITLTAATVITLAAPAVGRLQTISVVLRQDATGGRVPVMPNAAWPGGNFPSLNTLPGRFDVLQFSTIDGTNWFGTVVALGALTPAAPATPVVIATPGLTQGSVQLFILNGAANGSQITSNKLYRSTASGAEVLIGTINLDAANIYQDTGNTPGTTYFYKLTAVNAVGEGVQSVEASAIAYSGPARYLQIPGSGGLAATPASTGNDVTSGFLDVRIWAQFTEWNSLLLVSRFLKASSGDNSGNSQWKLGTTSGSLLSLTYYNTSNAYQYVGSSVALTTANPSSDKGIWLRAELNGTTGALTDAYGVSVAAGTVRFCTSTDGDAWTQLGTTQTANTGGIKTGTGGTDIAIAATGAGLNASQGKVFKAIVLDGAGAGVIKANPDFTALAANQTSFADTAVTPNTFTITNPFKVA